METQTPFESSSNTKNAMSSITLANQLNSPFLRLPGEIRNTIYEYLSTSSTMTFTLIKTSPFSCSFLFVPPPFLTTCTQIHYEARSLVYTRATYDVSTYSIQFLFCSPFNPEICGRIKRLRISQVLVSIVMQEGFKHVVEGESLARKVVLDSLPRVEDVCLVGGRGLGEHVLRKARKWFGEEGMEIVFQ